MARYETLRILLAFAIEKNMSIESIDIDTTFLNGELQEQGILMKPPAGIVAHRMLCKLNCGIYGLKQAGRTWDATLKQHLTENEFICRTGDQCLFSKKNK